MPNDVLNGFSSGNNPTPDSLALQDVLDRFDDLQDELQKTNKRLGKVTKKLKRAKKKNKKLEKKSKQSEERRWDGLAEKSLLKFIDVAAGFVDKKMFKGK